MRKSNETDVVELKRLQDQEIEIPIVGITPYIPHRWSEKAKRMMPGHPEKPELGRKKEPRDPEGEAESTVYRLDDGRPGIPAAAIKSAMVGACRHFDGLTMTSAKLRFFVMGEGHDQLVPLTEGTPILREDTPRNSNGGADLRYRYMFTNWKATVKIKFFGLTRESVVSLLDAAGRGGAGDWRPSSPSSATGTFGMWEVEEAA